MSYEASLVYKSSFGQPRLHREALVEKQKQKSTSPLLVQDQLPAHASESLGVDTQGYSVSKGKPCKDHNSHESQMTEQS